LYWIGLEDEFSAMIWNLRQLKHVFFCMSHFLIHLANTNLVPSIYKKIFFVQGRFILEFTSALLGKFVQKLIRQIKGRDSIESVYSTIKWIFKFIMFSGFPGLSETKMKTRPYWYWEFIRGKVLF
jgi:hypothetical protein